MNRGLNKPLPALPLTPITLKGFKDVDLGDNHQQSIDYRHNEQPQVGRKTLRGRWWALLIMLATAISVLVTAFIFTVKGQKCEAPSSSVVKQDTPTVALATAKVTTTKNIARKTRKTRRSNSGSQATPTGINAPTLTLCLDVLEVVCAMGESGEPQDLSAFADCEPLYIYLYCPLSDMTAHHDAIQASSSVVCPAMKSFCERSLHVNNNLRH
jgi:hypothetical protein